MRIARFGKADAVPPAGCANANELDRSPNPQPKPIDYLNYFTSFA